VTPSPERRCARDRRSRPLRRGSSVTIEQVCARNSSQMTHQCRAHALPLIPIDDDEGDLGRARLHDNVTAADDDDASRRFLAHAIKAT
jgi:hypothetical protein